GDEHSGRVFSVTGDSDYRGRLRPSDGRHTKSDCGATAAGRILQGCPGVATRSATNREEPTVQARVGDEVVRRGASYGHLHDVTGARRLSPVGNREVHQAVVACSPGQPCGGSVLATLPQ